METKGRLADRPLPELLLRVKAEGASGALTVRAGGGRRRLLFLDGTLAGVELPPKGLLPEAEARQELSSVARFAEGGFDWTPLEAPPQSPLGLDLEPLAIQACLHDTPIEHVGKTIYGLNAQYRCDPARLPVLSESLSDKEESALSAITAPAAASQILERLGSTERARRLLVAATLCRALTSETVLPKPAAPSPPSRTALPHPAATPPPAKPAPAPLPSQSLQDTENVRAKLDVGQLRDYVLAKRRTLSQSNHYQVLELPRDAPRRVIEEHYLRAIKKYHPDAYYGDMDGETKDAIEEIFVRINEAYNALNESGRRGDYDRLLDSGLVSRSQLTEEDFLLSKTQLESGKRQLDDGDWRAARATLESARRLNPDSSEVQGYLAKAYLEGGVPNRMPDMAKDLLDKALDQEPDRGVFHLFMGDYLRIRGDNHGAARYYQNALTLDKELSAAKIALKEIQQGQAGTRTPLGVLGALFKKK